MHPCQHSPLSQHTLVCMHPRIANCHAARNTRLVICSRVHAFVGSVLIVLPLLQVLIAGLKMSARAASELGQQLVDIASDKQPQFVQILETTPELWR